MPDLFGGRFIQFAFERFELLQLAFDALRGPRR